VLNVEVEVEGKKKDVELEGLREGEKYTLITTLCHNPIFDLFILIIFLTKKNDEKNK
jgi:hypothetical protein